MYAVIETGGKQYRVQSGDRIHVELLDAPVKSKYVFDKVLFLSKDDEHSEVGSPYLKGVKVTGRIIEHTKGDKLVVFKMKRRKGMRRRRGHRQDLTVVEITDIAVK